MEKVLDKFLRYVKIDTQSKDDADVVPSTAKQRNLASLLADELRKMGVDDVTYDENLCFVYAIIPANNGDATGETVGFISHMDTAPDASGENVKPRIIENYDGNDIVLNKAENVILSTKKFPEIRDYVGKTLVVTDGTTLLGADDKAGVSEIMTMAEYLLTHPEIKHKRIAIAFTPDEEVAGGVDYFDIKKFGADYAYTIDGGAIGELEYENFNAASAELVFHGVDIHTGEAKNKMINSMEVAMEFCSMLPEFEKPQYTEKYEGFIHLEKMEGTVEKTNLSFLIRDHDMGKFQNKKNLISNAAAFINQKYGANTVEVQMDDTYFNMHDKIYPEYMFLIDNVMDCMHSLGIEPKIQPVRGGTDGARLSYMGLPCPNICTGGHNFHGKYEYVCVESMEKIVALLVEIVQE